MQNLTRIATHDASASCSAIRARALEHDLARVQQLVDRDVHRGSPPCSHGTLRADLRGPSPIVAATTSECGSSCQPELRRGWLTSVLVLPSAVERYRRP